MVSRRLPKSNSPKTQNFKMRARNHSTSRANEDKRATDDHPRAMIFSVLIAYYTPDETTLLQKMIV